MIDVHVQIYKRDTLHVMNVSLGGLLYFTSSARTFSGMFDFNPDTCRLRVCFLRFNPVGFSIVDDYHIYALDDDTKVTDLLQFL